MRRKLGLSTAEPEDRQLAEDLLQAMQRGRADFTSSFRALCDAARDPQGGAVGDEEWMRRWRARFSRESTAPGRRAETMQQANPAYIPRNHRVEQAIVAAVERGDFAPFEELSKVLAAPHVARAAFAAYANPPEAHERVLQTFCGT
jgi:uncharacterized protein YdiU (UPF0061 family)